jgi:bifunctional non-homologous end joining protein LigD
MDLREYKRKRDFKKTPEPEGKKINEKDKLKVKRKNLRRSQGHVYCIQKHDASHLHYDLRLQLDGVLKSWAIPKGPSLDPHEKRLAVEVEDHPVAYAQFEGNIPSGYGAGEVIVWDFGSWRPLEDPYRGLQKGHLEFEIKGKKLHGKWILVRTKKESRQKQWLLIKSPDKDAKSESDFPITEKETASVLSGRLLKRDNLVSPTMVKEKVKRKSTRGLDISFIEPQLARLAKTPPEGPDWLHEIKFDGYRTLTKIVKGKATLFTRNGLDWTSKYKNLQNEIARMQIKNAWLDGEIVRLDEKGRSDFQLLQNGLLSKKQDLIYYLFDLLTLDGEDWRDKPLIERKAKLAEILNTSKCQKIIFSEHWTQKGARVLAQCCKAGLEGIVSKDKNSPYLSGRGTGWLKTKCSLGQEFVIIGYTKPSGRRQGFGSLLIASYDKNQKLIYSGRVGTGFNEISIRDLMARFQPLLTKKTPVTNAKDVPDASAVQWLKPRLVADVQFAQWTRDKILRHPSFHGLRFDKPAAEVKRDQPLDAKTLENRQNAKTKPKYAGIRLTNPDKVLITASNVRKKDLAEYYYRIQKWILPHLKERPLSLVRCPDGIERECFFQKNLTDSTQIAIRQDSFKRPNGKSEHLIYIENAAGLLALAQMAVIEIHTWATHRTHFMNPDQIVFDLDPGPGVKWSQIAEAALALRNILQELKLQSFVKTSGGKGLHVCVPIAPYYSWDQAKAFSKALAQYMIHNEPKRYVAVMTKKKRTGKIFIDYLRNTFGATAVAAYSVRARDEAGVSMPVEWDDIRKIRPSDFNIKNVASFLEHRKVDPWADYNRIQQRLPMEEME